MSRNDGAVADRPEQATTWDRDRQVDRRTGRKLVVLAAGGVLVGLAITLATGREQLVGAYPWSRTLLLLAAVVIAAGVGALITRSITATGQATEQAEVRLRQVSTTLDSAMRQAEETPPADGDTLAVQARVDAVSRRLDSVSSELAALRHSGNRTAWVTFFLGALLGVITQVTLG
ncbi:hypothetical protein ACN27F_24600 [Solwaraspora sp. WMMB335]|uniref:hypothetical protein n=1 Tax=Solwaraspora sp. WMMB335 TaxID=3404118 RepID=UPI003B963FA3